MWPPCRRISVSVHPKSDVVKPGIFRSSVAWCDGPCTRPIPPLRRPADFRHRKRFMIGHRISGVRFWPLPEAVGGDWTDRARRAAVELAEIQPEDNSLGIQLLASIQSMFERGQTDRLSSETIVHALADSEDRPWPERLPFNIYYVGTRTLSSPLAGHV